MVCVRDRYDKNMQSALLDILDKLTSFKPAIIPCPYGDNF